ncbi:MAG: hypothetical protein ACE5FT_07510 [Candidatus Nanoarchaeia archaeon]
MPIKVEIHLTNKWLYFLVAVISLLVLSVGVFAFNSGQLPSALGHSGEEIEVNVTGVIKLLDNALSDLDSKTLTTLNTGALDSTTEDSAAQVTLVAQGCTKLNNEDPKYGANHWMACPQNFYVAAITDDFGSAQDVLCCPFDP